LITWSLLVVGAVALYTVVVVVLEDLELLQVNQSLLEQLTQLRLVAVEVVGQHLR